MKILIANKFYYPRGGDCIYTINLQRMLEKEGHEVAVFAMQYPKNLASPWSRYWPLEMKTSDILHRPFGDKEVKRCFGHLLDDFRPDVVHLNNIHTQLSPVIAEMAHERGIRTVWTLHDTKPICPCYTCTRGGKWCEECFNKPTSVIRYRCMPGSLPGAAVGYAELRKWNPQRLMNATDMFLPPSEFLAETLQRGGYDRGKMTVMCNFIDDDKVRDPKFRKEDHYIYVGRINEVKGVRTLCRAASALPYRLIIVGDGELLDELRREYSGSSNIEFRGHMDWDQFRPLLESARMLVIPSEWSENNPLTVIEAQSVGTPVLGARIGGIPELIDEGTDGMTFRSGDSEDLKDKIRKMIEAYFDYKQIAQRASERYSQKAYYRKLMELYTRGSASETNN